MTGRLLGSLITDWSDFDGWCAARGLDAATMLFPRAIAAYRHMVESRLATVDDWDEYRAWLNGVGRDERLPDGAPTWWKGEEQAWADFEAMP